MTTPRLSPRRLALAGTVILAAQGAGPAQAAPPCPSEDFPTFLSAFENDVALQKAFVVLPLRSDSVDPDASSSSSPSPRF